MSDTSEIVTTARTPAKDRPDIMLADDTARPRARFAEEDLHVCDKTVARMGLPTVYIANVAHVLVNASRRMIAGRARSRSEQREQRTMRRGPRPKP